tara:strand:- start:1276 stop:1422 length:147 start_codon:yes stop_codon:yes gene_type:complete
MVAQRSLTMLFFCALLFKVCVHLLFRKEADAQQSGRFKRAITLANRSK